MTSITIERERRVDELLSQVRGITAGGQPDLSGLRTIRDLLVDLAARTELFPDAHFPPPGSDQMETLYGLSEDADRSHALYVYRPAPGKVTVPHNHATWAVVAGIEGDEPTIVWKRLDGSTDPGACLLTIDRMLRVTPATGVYYQADDIHSIAIGGDRPIKHMHLYGHSLLDLPARIDFDPVARTCQRAVRKPTVLAPLAS